MSATSLHPLGATGRAVFVDADPFAEPSLTGIGRYTARLALALAEARGGPVRFFSRDTEILAPRGLTWSHDQDLARWARRVWRGRRARLDRDEIPDDALAFYGCMRPSWRLFPFEVSALHDFTPLLVSATHSVKTRLQFQRFYAQDLLASDAAVAISHSTKHDASWLCDFDADKIVVAHPGPSLCVERHLDETAVTRRPEVGLVVSTLEPRKNANFLLDWFSETRALPDGAELWWVGAVGWLTSRRKLRGYRSGLKNGRKVRFLGVKSDAELCRLYRTAGWSAYPSLYEGFGLPVLDALRHGMPVLASYHSSLRELDHPGVHGFDPYDPASLDIAWDALRADRSVVSRRTLDTLYDWRSVARAVLALGMTPADRQSARAA